MCIIGPGITNILVLQNVSYATNPGLTQPAQRKPPDEQGPFCPLGAAWPGDDVSYIAAAAARRVFAAHRGLPSCTHNCRSTAALYVL